MSESLTPQTFLSDLRNRHLDELADLLAEDPDDVEWVLIELQSKLDPDTETPTPTHCVLYTDGAARNNPGPAGGGAVLYSDSGEELLERKEYFGDRLTNNAAEYRALLLGLRAVPEECSRITLRLDSQLIVKQLRGEYQVKSENLAPLYREVVDLLDRFADVEVEHVPRDQNEEADRLANQAIDTHRTY